MTDELPSSFDEWPREDRVEYLTNTRKKRAIAEAVLSELAVDDVHVRPQTTLKKRDWAKVLLAAMEPTDGGSDR